MSRYSDLRWKISDLEKELAEEKVYTKKLHEELNTVFSLLVDKEREIERLKCVINEIGKAE